LEVIDYQRGPVQPQTPQPTDKSHISRLVDCDKFVLDRWQFDTPRPAGSDQRFHILAVLQGAVHVQGDAADQPLGRGQTILLPAAAGEVRLAPVAPTVLLDAYLP
jgi:mannose-6-phosphate isomerase class I